MQNVWIVMSVILTKPSVILTPDFLKVTFCPNGERFMLQ